MYFNIHTHHSAQDTDYTVAVSSLYSDFALASSGRLCSLGLHPWYLENHVQLLQELKKYAGLANVLAIGECGLDKLCHTNWNLQLAVFREQIVLADTLCKPLIIHCVRASDELIKIVDEQRPTVPVIVHGFNNKGGIAEKLINNGMYLSFGAAILNHDSPAAHGLRNIPAEKFFLETDNADVAIGDIYRAAAALRNVTEEEVILQVQHNFTAVFNYQK